MSERTSLKYIYFVLQLLFIRHFPSKDVATLISTYKKEIICICFEMDSKVLATKEDVAKTKLNIRIHNSS